MSIWSAVGDLTSHATTLLSTLWCVSLLSYSLFTELQLPAHTKADTPPNTNIFSAIYSLHRDLAPCNFCPQNARAHTKNFTGIHSRALLCSRSSTHGLTTLTLFHWKYCLILIRKYSTELRIVGPSFTVQVPKLCHQGCVSTVHLSLPSSTPKQACNTSATALSHKL